MLLNPFTAPLPPPSGPHHVNPPLPIEGRKTNSFIHSFQQPFDLLLPWPQWHNRLLPQINAKNSKTTLRTMLSQVHLHLHPSSPKQAPTNESSPILQEVRPYK